MTNQNLIGLIYDAALEPTLWPKLLASLATELDSYTDVISIQNKSHLLVNSAYSYQDGLLANNDQKILEDHIARACEISSKIRSKNDEYQLERTLLDHITLPSFLVDEHAQLVTTNLLGKDFISSAEDITLSQNKLYFSDFNVRRKFQDCITEFTGNSKPAKKIIPFLSQKKRESNSVLVLNIPNYDQRFLVIIATTQHLVNVDKQALETVFGLTKAEIKLADNLLAGATLSEMSKSHFLSIHTLRTQLKSIFVKTNTKRQSELIRTLLTYSLGTSTLLGSTQAKLDSNLHVDNPKHHQTIILDDGRTLGFAEFGNLTGQPILLFHPATGSRLQAHPDESIATAFNARIIIADRPGYGLSSQMEKRTLLDWPKDVAQLMKQLKLKKVSIIGFCGGSPYALACAYSIPELITSVTCVSGVTPYDNINLMHGVSPTNKLLIKLAIKMPDRLFHVISLILKGLVKQPEGYLDSVHDSLCITDQRALAEPELINNFIAALQQAFIQGPSAFTREQYILSQAWPFDVNTLSVPVTLWHGNNDHHVDVELAKRLANNIPSATLNVVDGFGHFLIYHKWRDILSQHINNQP